jgi:hypothetical protein
MLTPWVLTGVLVTFVLLIFLVELEYFGWSTLLMIATIASVQFLHVANIWEWAKQNYILTLVCIAMYLLLGVVWSFAKWIFFLRKFNRKRLEVIDQWKFNPKQSETRAGKDTEEVITNLLQREHYKKTNLASRPVAAQYKTTIIEWMLWWPISMIGTFLNDPVRDLFNFMYEHLSGLYQQMADKIVPDIEKKKGE